MTLALLGGHPVVTVPHPHNVLDGFTQEDRRAITAFLERDDSKGSYDRRGGVVADFEDELAAYHGRKYCILMNSGTSALHSAYFGLGLEPGDEVIAPTYTYFATVTAMLGVGAVPVLEDCEVETGNLDPGNIDRSITKRTRAIAVTHQWGHPAEMDDLVTVAEQHGLAVLEDSSLSFASQYRGRLTGSMGRVAAFSLGAGKLIAGGQGGALLTDDDDIAERATLLGQPGRLSPEREGGGRYSRFASTGYGQNFRMHPLAVAMSRARFARLRQLIAERHERLSLLSQLLGGQDVLTPPVTRPYVHRGQWGGYVTTFHAERAGGVSIDGFARALRAEGLEVSPRGYHPLLHRTAFFRSMEDSYFPRRQYALNKRTYREGDLPAAEAHVDNQIGFPTFLHEPEALIRQYAEAVHKVVEGLPELAAAEATS